MSVASAYLLLHNHFLLLFILKEEIEIYNKRFREEEREGEERREDNRENECRRIVVSAGPSCCLN
jgi:hypothetical protein